MTSVIDPSADTGSSYDRLIKPDKVHGSLYTNPVIFTEELHKIWYRTWVFVGNESEANQPGDYVRKRLGLQEQIPARTPPPQTVTVRESAVVVRRGERVLLVQRPDSGRWANMWEFPHLELTEAETHEAAAERCVRDLLGIKAEVGGEIVTIRHGVTRFSITMVCLEARYVEGEFHSAFYQKGVWLPPAELSAYPVSSAQRRLIGELTKPNRQRGLF